MSEKNLSVDDYNAYMRVVKEFIAETNRRMKVLPDYEKIAKMTYSQWYHMQTSKKLNKQ